MQFNCLKSFWVQAEIQTENTNKVKKLSNIRPFR